ncbi:hypothetical protein IHN32_09860 [Deinococcus sp. 14RED07]|uniref:hypothetical protein n=1 Tax=Deinococcus sp. 14RED07 TaxID=2745874 RepID=UPI001E4A774B|nr:hypothetical protein [Deinococcus sp. 14RED07]MCD0176245.1 hypothetical protein [Deinococcus sp. 14RED07]
MTKFSWPRPSPDFAARPFKQLPPPLYLKKLGLIADSLSILLIFGLLSSLVEYNRIQNLSLYNSILVSENAASQSIARSYSEKYCAKGGQVNQTDCVVVKRIAAFNQYIPNKVYHKIISDLIDESSKSSSVQDLLQLENSLESAKITQENQERFSEKSCIKNVFDTSLFALFAMSILIALIKLYKSYVEYLIEKRKN